MSEFVDSVALGVLQGLTEFLPVSSSGHLQALKTMQDSPELASKTLDIFLHFATLLAVFLVFRRDFVQLARGCFGGGEPRRRLLLVLVGAVPAGVVGLIIKKFDLLEGLETSFPYLVPICWLLTAGALWSLRKQVDGAREIDLKLALWVGCWQALAILPGVSRSGITIVSALWLGCRRESAATFSFLTATPLILGATVLEILDVFGSEGTGMAAGSVWPYLAGGVAAFVTGLGALVLLLRMLRGGALHRWAFYLVPVAVAYTAWLLLRNGGA
ncbi:MAG: undecaprenyl-diphosphate phosphatase [Planctomycetota bacterium]